MTKWFSRRTVLAAALAAPALRTARAAVPVRVGFIPVLGSSPLFVANGTGWAREAGLALSLTQFESGPNAIQAVASGTLDAYVAGFGPVAVARSRGVDLRIVAATAVDELVVIARGPLARAFAENRDARSAFDAFASRERRAAKLATQPAGSVPNTVLQHWLRETVKADPARYEVVPMGIDATQQALLSGAVDGATVREPALTIVRERDPNVALVAWGRDLFATQPGGVLAVTGAFIEREATAAVDLVRVFVRATALLREQPDAALPHVAAVLGRGIVPEPVIRRALSSPASTFVADPRLIIEPIKGLLAYQVTLGATREVPPIDGLFDDRLYRRAVGESA